MKVYLVGPSYQFDDDPQIFSSPEAALKYYEDQENQENKYLDADFNEESKVKYSLSEDKTIIYDENGDDAFYIEVREVDKPAS